MSNEEIELIHQAVHVDDHVRLACSIPELALHRGDVGIVCSIWRAPIGGFEVEFREAGAPFGIRALLREEQLEAKTVSSIA